MDNKKLTVTLKPWDYTCGDGCCSDSGLTIAIDGVEVTDYGNQEDMLIRAILNHLGYTVSIIGLDENGEEIWEA